jgi:hypothetical protein
MQGEVIWFSFKGQFMRGLNKPFSFIVRPLTRLNQTVSFIQVLLSVIFVYLNSLQGLTWFRSLMQFVKYLVRCCFEG